MMYSYNVGKDFSFGFLKKINSNCCYDKEKGILYSNDLKNFSNLGINLEDDKVSHLETVAEYKENPLEDQQKDEIPEVKQEVKQETLATGTLGQRISKLEEIQKENLEYFAEKDYILNTKINAIETLLKQIVEIQTEDNEIKQQDDIEKNNKVEVLKNSVGVLNKKIKSSNEEIKTINSKFEALIEIISENKSQDSQLPGFATMSEMKLSRIWNTITDKNSAALISIMLMFKKMLEDKGLKV